MEDGKTNIAYVALIAVAVVILLSGLWYRRQQLLRRYREQQAEEARLAEGNRWAGAQGSPFYTATGPVRLVERPMAMARRHSKPEFLPPYQPRSDPPPAYQGEGDDSRDDNRYLQVTPPRQIHNSLSR
ncbi:hypothetical protein GGF46_004763 [Coemansia sp. RSA 552]|nr:hypothetical protein GGF46_004763 [Coemansia sp. RSA 552]